MNFNLTKVTAVVSELGRPTFDRLILKFRKDAAVEHQYQRNQEVGMYGLLVSKDVTHRH
jgi:hypothetical protein